MKTKLLTLFFLSLSFIGFAQVYEGDLYLLDQKDVDNFNYTVINGSLFISETEPHSITNLDGLNKLISIKKNLIIEANTALTTLSGLDNLKSIGLNLSIRNTALTNLNGLDNLESIGLGFYAFYNTSLTSFSGLDKLTSIGGYFTISANNMLTTLNGLDNLTSIGGYFQISGNNMLTTLNGLDNLTSIGGYLSISSNNMLTTLNGLDNINSINGDLQITYNKLLFDLCSIGHLIISGQITENKYMMLYNGNNPSYLDIQDSTMCAVSVGDNGNGVFGGDITLTTQEEVNSFNFKKVTGSLIIRQLNNSSSPIINLDGLDSLVSVGADLKIDYNYDLTSINGLSNLTHVGARFQITSSKLEFLSGLEKLNYIGLSLNLLGNKINSLSALHNLMYVGSLVIRKNYNLTSLNGLEKLEIIKGSIEIDDNNSLTDLSGLKNVTSVNGQVDIDDNDNLTTLNGLENLVSIGSSLNIANNKSLKNLNNLTNLESIGGNFIVLANDSLTSLGELPNLYTIDNKKIYIGTYTLGRNYGNMVLTDFCGLKKIVQNIDTSWIYNVAYNAVNPTIDDLKNEKCGEQEAQTVSIPTLLTPLDEATEIPNNNASLFSWSESKWTDTTKTAPIAYQFHLWEEGQTPVIQFVPAGNTSPNTISTKENTTYFWKVVAIDGQNNELATSETWSFTTKGTSTTSELTYVPDDNFEQALIKLKLDDVLDNYVKTSNINTLESLVIVHEDIADLTGIENFVALKELFCFYNDIENLDLSKNINLENLECNNNNLKSLDLSKNVALKKLNCSENSIENLDFGENIILEELSYGVNKLPSLDVSKFTNLKVLSCGYNNVETLNLSNNTRLVELYCGFNNINELDLSNNNLLKEIYCVDNNISILDVENKTDLVKIFCENNAIVNLDLSKKPLLEHIECKNNKIEKLDLNESVLLNYLDCSNNNLNFLNVQNNNNANFTYFNAKENPNLQCVEVDNIAYANSTPIWRSFIDSDIAGFSENCYLPNKVNIINLDDDLNNMPLTLYPGGIAHRYYKVIDEENNPVRGAVINYILANQSFSSTPSDINGIADLKINIGGKYPYKDDDIVTEKGEYPISFDKVTPSFGEQQVEIGNNVFESNFDLILKDFLQVEKTQGIFYGSKLEGSAAVSAFFNKAGISGSIGSSYYLDVVFHKNESTEKLESIDLNLKYKGELGASRLKAVYNKLNFLDIVKIKGEIKDEIDKEYHAGLEMSLNLNLLSVQERALHFLRVVLTIYNVVDETNITTYKMVKYLDSYLKENNNGKIITIPEIGGFYGKDSATKLTSSASLNLNIGEGIITSLIPVKADIEITRENVFETGQGAVYNYKLINDQGFGEKSSYALSLYSNISDSDFTKLGLKVGPFGTELPIIENINFNENKKIKFEHLYNNSNVGTSNNIKGTGKITSTITTNAADYNLLGSDFTKSTSIEYALGNKALNSFRNLNPSMSFFSKKPSLSVDSAINDLIDLKENLGFVNTENWTNEEFSYKKEESYGKTSDLNLSIDFLDQEEKFLLWEYEVNVKSTMTLGVNWGSNYPIEKKIFIPKLGQILPIYENIGATNLDNYIDSPTESDVKLYLTDGLNIFKNSFKKIAGFFEKNIKKGSKIIYESFTEYLNEIASREKTRDGYVQKIASKNDISTTSIFKFNHLNNESFIAADTEINLTHLFTNGELKGITKNNNSEEKQKILIISDLMFFKAINNGAIINESLSDFEIDVEVGLDDLKYFNVNNTEEIVVELFFSTESSTEWESLGIVKEDSNFKSSKFGVYALGVRLIADSEKPNISKLSTDIINKKISYEISDKHSGVNWSTLRVEVDGSFYEYQINENEIEISFPSDDNEIHVFDIWVEDNYGNTQNFNETINFNTLNTLEEELLVVQFYPNPVKDKITISSKEEIKEIIIYNALSQKVFSSTPNSVKINLDLSEFKQGVYIVKLKSENSYKTYSIIKN